MGTELIFDRVRWPGWDHDFEFYVGMADPNDLRGELLAGYSGDTVDASGLKIAEAMLERERLLGSPTAMRPQEMLRAAREGFRSQLTFSHGFYLPQATFRLFAGMESPHDPIIKAPYETVFLPIYSGFRGLNEKMDMRFEGVVIREVPESGDYQLLAGSRYSSFPLNASYPPGRLPRFGDHRTNRGSGFREHPEGPTWPFDEASEMEFNDRFVGNGKTLDISRITSYMLQHCFDFVFDRIYWNLCASLLCNAFRRVVVIDTPRSLQERDKMRRKGVSPWSTIEIGDKTLLRYAQDQENSESGRTALAHWVRYHLRLLRSERFTHKRFEMVPVASHIRGCGPLVEKTYVPKVMTPKFSLPGDPPEHPE